MFDAKSLDWRLLMTPFKSKYATESKFNVINLEKSVQESLVSTLMMPGPFYDDANEADSLLPLNQIVRLMKNIPESSLHCGELGIVISIWCAPIVAYEVEFLRLDEDCRTRVLVFGRHLKAEPQPTHFDQTAGSKGRVNTALHAKKGSDASLTKMSAIFTAGRPLSFT
jgi:hypothetical protein